MRLLKESGHNQEAWQLEIETNISSRPSEIGFRLSAFFEIENRAPDPETWQNQSFRKAGADGRKLIADCRRQRTH